MSTEDDLRSFLESKRFLVSPTFRVSDQREGMFVYCPKGFDSIFSAIGKMPSVKLLERPQAASLALARFKVGDDDVSLSQTWEPWVAVMFPAL
jgi:hypothetical protein